MMPTAKRYEEERDEEDQPDNVDNDNLPLYYLVSHRLVHLRLKCVR